MKIYICDIENQELKWRKEQIEKVYKNEKIPNTSNTIENIKMVSNNVDEYIKNGNNIKKLYVKITFLRFLYVLLMTIFITRQTLCTLITGAFILMKVMADLPSASAATLHLEGE